MNVIIDLTRLFKKFSWDSPNCIDLTRSGYNNNKNGEFHTG